MYINRNIVLSILAVVVVKTKNKIIERKNYFESQLFNICYVKFLCLSKNSENEQSLPCRRCLQTHKVK